MALLRRAVSLKRSNNTYQTTRKTGTDNAERPKGMFRCHVTLLDDTVFTCDVDKHSYGEALLNEVYSHLDILERDYFGLSYPEDLVTKWLDPSKHLKKQFKGTNVIQVNFRVKFYVTDPGRLHEELTRYQFYLQVKKDLLTTRLPCPPEAQALLGAYIIQAELGDFDPRKHSTGYISHYRLVSKQTTDLEEQVTRLHQTLVGKHTAEAEFQFLTYARRLEFYGVEFFRARDQHGVELGLGITCNGISVYKGRTHIITFSWSQVLRITYKRKKFYIELRETDQSGMVGFYMDTQEGCKQLWKNCIQYHAFFHRPPPSSDSSHRKSRSSRSFRRKSRSKTCVERTEVQAVEATRAAAVERSKSMKVVRNPSGSFRRVKSKTPSSRDTSPEVGVASVRRVQSLGRNTSRTIFHLPTNGRNSSFDQEVEDDHESMVYSPGMCVSDDMTGQFSLVATPGVRRVSIASSVSLQDNGPTEFYDERNAMEAQLEARLGHVTGDELAANGLLMIRLSPDSNGRYGFIVKGGSDEKMPVIVTRVSPNSPASLCCPPLEEGDQVVYINGKSVSEKPHEQIVTLIRTSCELVIVLKPRNLQKVLPSLRIPSGVATPPLHSFSAPKLNDPGHMLRESLTSLKGSLISGKGQLHFDKLYRKKPGMSASASRLPQNLVKNRYRDILAYDDTRVMLQEGPDYINANYVNMEVYTTGQIIRYIASQGPMQHTTKDLWQMIWEERVTLLLMLTEVVESGKVRCCRYWPEVNCTQEYGRYGVTTLSEQADRVFVTRRIRLKNKMTGEDRCVVQMQYTDWPDHGIPGSKVDFLRFVQGVRSAREGMLAPVVVHCSAGIGRTGVLIMLETALCKMEVQEAIYPLDVVRHMRDQRGLLVQTPMQYQFVCESILKAYEDDYVEIELPTRRQTPSATAL